MSYIMLLSKGGGRVCVWGKGEGGVNMLGVLNLPTKKIFRSPIYLIKYRENFFFFSDIQICIISGG